MTPTAPLFRVNPRILLPLLIALHLAVLGLIVEALDGEEQPYGSAGQVVSPDGAPARAHCEPGYASDFAVQALIDYRQAQAPDAPSRQPCVIFR